MLQQGYTSGLGQPGHNRVHAGAARRHACYHIFPIKSITLYAIRERMLDDMIPSPPAALLLLLLLLLAAIGIWPDPTTAPLPGK